MQDRSGQAGGREAGGGGGGRAGLSEQEGLCFDVSR